MLRTGDDPGRQRSGVRASSPDGGKAVKQLERSHDGITHLPSPAESATPQPRVARRQTTRRRSAASPAMVRDVWVYRIVVSAFAAVLLIAALGALLLPLSGARVSEMSGTLLVALTSGAVGALAGLLAPSPQG
jgi:hypothetical protein